MKELRLFQAPDGSWISNTQLLSILNQVGATDAQVLYIHSGLTLGVANPELGRQGLLGELYQIVSLLEVPTICLPTFTFSFCNGEDYDVQASRSKMGALNEYIRKLPGTIRSLDPLMSTALIGRDDHLLRNLGKHSLGENSLFDRLHDRGKEVKFLFLGAALSECFTYTHYVEERVHVPYRYDRMFSGKITSGEQTWEDTYTLFVRYKGVVTSTSGLLEKELLSRNLLRKVACGASSVSCVDEPDAYGLIIEQLRKDTYSYIAADPKDRNTEFYAQHMVSL